MPFLRRPAGASGLLVAILVGFGAGGCESDRDRAMDAYAEARTVRAGDPERAAALLEEAVRLHPPFHEGHAMLAEVRLEQQKFTEAEHAAQEAVRLHETAGYRETLGHALAGQERWDHAIDAWQRALTLDEGRHHLHLAVADAYEKLGRPADASEAYARVLALRDEGTAVDDAVYAEACVARVRLLLDAEEWERGGSLLDKCREAEGIEDRAEDLARLTERIEAHEAQVAEQQQADAALATEEAERLILNELRRDTPGILEALSAHDVDFGSAFGDDPGALMGEPTGDTFGFGGVGLRGTGVGGGGTGEGTIGLGRIGTIGHGGGDGTGYGRGSGGLDSSRSAAPDAPEEDPSDDGEATATE